MQISVETVVRAPLAEVWRAYTTPDDIRQWNAASSDWHTTSASVDLRVGGVFSSRMEARDGSAGFDFTGTYTAIVPHERIDSIFGGRHCSVGFRQQAEGVRVRIDFESEPNHTIEQQRVGWQAILDNFRRHVEARRE